MPGAYYNEIDPFSVEWLRHLIKANLIAPGDVDDRDIRAVHPDDLRPYTQCHFFAGIGGWSHALRLARWPDNKPVWTGSCPCQPFSIAGKQSGLVDERHLWPGWFHLIEECRPNAIFGEQVEAAIRLGWLDLVQTDLEGIGYTFGTAVLPAAGFGAPHVRHRLYFVAHTDQLADTQHLRRECVEVKRSASVFNALDGATGPWIATSPHGTSPDQLADPAVLRLRQECQDGTGGVERSRAQGGTTGLGLRGPLNPDNPVDGMAHPDCGDQPRNSRGSDEGIEQGSCRGVWEADRDGAHGSAVADPNGSDQSRNSGRGPEGIAPGDEWWGSGFEADSGRASGGAMAHDAGERRERGKGLPSRGVDDRDDARRQEGHDGSLSLSEAGVLRTAPDLLADPPDGQFPQPVGGPEGRNGDGPDCAVASASPLAGFWRNADWLLCRDGKWRAVEPGTQPLAHGAPSRMGRLRGYGNAIVPQVAQAFIESWCEAVEEIGNDH